MTYLRYQRVGSLIQEELNKIIIRELEFPETLVTITSVEVQKDLEYANVNISTIPSEKNNGVLKILEKNKGKLQHLLLKKINIKPMPKLRFKIDIGLEKAAEIEKDFLKIEKENENG